MPRKKKNLRSDKRFCVRLDIGRNENGTRKRLPFYSYISLEDAEAQRDEYIAQHPADADPADRGITLSKWGERWLRVYKAGLSDNTKDGYSSAVNSICAYNYVDDNGATASLGEMKVADIRQYHIQAYITSLMGKSKSTIRIASITINQMLEAAVDDRIITNSPLKKLTIPTGTYTGHRAIEDWEKVAIEITWAEQRAGVWAMLMLYSGIRRGEMAALEWEDINMETRTITISSNALLRRGGIKKRTKTEAGKRTVPIIKPLYDMLSKIRPENAAGRVCLSATGKQLNESSYKRGWESYMLVLERAANGLEPYGQTKGWRTEKARANEGHVIVDIDAHDLRYTYATMLYDLDVDVKTAQYLLGHTDLETTMKIYTQLSKKKKMSSLDKLISHFEQHAEGTAVQS